MAIGVGQGGEANAGETHAMPAKASAGRLDTLLQACEFISRIPGKIDVCMPEA
jgi:hypothetical protein